jgi:hypothetical protein
MARKLVLAEVRTDDGRVFKVLDVKSRGLYAFAGFPAKEAVSEYPKFGENPGDIEFISADIGRDCSVSFSQKPFYARWWDSPEKKRARADVNIYLAIDACEEAIEKHIRFAMELISSGELPETPGRCLEKAYGKYLAHEAQL